MRLLVTGGAGFIGSNFVLRTRETRPDWSITVLDSMSYAANRASLDPVLGDGGWGRGWCVRLVVGSVADAAVVDPLVADCDVVVHFAAESHNDNSLDSPWPFVESNVVGTFTLLEAIRKHDKRLHHISTDEVYGDLELDDPQRFTEATPVNPSSPYSATKAGADLLVRAWIRSFGINATVSNCSNNYGPRQHVEKFIPRQITNILAGHQAQALRLRAQRARLDPRRRPQRRRHRDPRAGTPRRDLPHRRRRRAQQPRDRRSCCSSCMGKPADWFEHVNDRPGHDLRYAIDSSKLRAETDWRPRYSDIRAGLEATVAWYRDNEAWWQTAKDEAEHTYARLGR